MNRTFITLLTAVANDRTLGPSAEFRCEVATVRDPATPWEFSHRTTSEAAIHTAEVWGGKAFAARRHVIEWPDGTRVIGVWEDITYLEKEEESCSPGSVSTS